MCCTYGVYQIKPVLSEGLSVGKYVCIKAVHLEFGSKFVFQTVIRQFNNSFLTTFANTAKNIFFMRMFKISASDLFVYPTPGLAG